MASALLSSIRSKTSQVLGSVRRWAASPSSSSDPRSSILEDLEELERTLKRIQAVLHDAEEREIRDEAVKLWLKELKEVVYDAEDVLDEYHYEVLRAQVEGRASHKRKQVEGDDEEQVSSSLSTILNVSIPDGMGDRIREIRKRFREISEDRERLRLREEDGERRVFGALSPPPTSHMVDESSIYGREHDKRKVIDLLFSEGTGNGISVIPIVGKGGLGKTTIAQLVYNDSKVKGCFDLTGWVCVPVDFDVPRLTKAIIDSLTKKSCDLTPLSTLQDTLKEKVKGKRVLLVLDDVWNEQQSHWESLRIPFVGAETVRIIVTCRNDSVAKIMQTVHPYRPGYLSEDESWSLFKHYAFGGPDPEEQPHLADIGEQIVNKCSGLPLAVKTIGSLLRHKMDEDSWMEVLQSDLWEPDKNNEILASLRLSYDRMPAHLKPCFVYCSMFPKDYVFHRDVLVQSWMAQGYIPPQGRKTMEDIGDEYFNDLLRRSFFDSDFNYSGYNGFKMHDMIHDLAKFISEKLPISPDKVRHLYVRHDQDLSPQNHTALRTSLPMNQYGRPIVIQEMTQFSLLRCLDILWGEIQIPDLFGNLKHLRYLYITSDRLNRLPESVCLLYHLQALILECDALAELPNGIGNLINLRYFFLYSNAIERLPKSVCQLRNLRSLDLYSCSQLEELPTGIGSLTNLRHLGILSTPILCLPAGIEKLTNLQRLRGRFEVQGGIGVLKDLVNLQLQGYLCISGLRNLVSIEDAKDVGLKYKHKLEDLYLFWDVNSDDACLYPVDDIGLHLEVFLEENKDVPTDEKREEALLEYLQPPANLKKLYISGYGGSKFPEWVGYPLSFASLREIHIIGCQNVRSLPLYIHDSLGKLDASKSKSMLERVSISGCPKLTSKGGLHNLHSVEKLEISVCPQLLILSKEGLPSKLKSLHIRKCQRLTSLPGMQNLTSLELLDIRNCPQLRLLSEEGLPSKLQKLYFMECQRLTSLPGMQNLTSLEALNICNCPQLRLLSEEGLPFKLQSLYIRKCQRLTSLPGMQNLTSLEALHILNCPQLRFLSEEGPLPSMLKSLHIWKCQQLTSLPGMQNLTSLGELTIVNCPQLRLLSEEGLPSKLQSLHIKDCQRLTSLPGMQNLTSLKALHICNCPQLRLLSQEGLPSKLQSLYIEKCRRLTSLPGMQSLTSLEALDILSCPQLRRLSEEGLPSKLKSLYIWKCQQLTSLPGMQSLTSLGELTIQRCPQLHLLSEEGLPSKLQSLHIEDCQQLTSLSGMQNLTSLTRLTINGCPKLQIMVEDQLSSMPRYVDIIDCPGLVKWCEIQQIDCIQVISSYKLIISNTYEKIMHGFDDSTSIKHLCFTNSWRRIREKFSELTIWGCTDIPPIRCLPGITSLQSLVIKDSPGIRHLPAELLPSTLNSLVVDSCEELRCLHLGQQNRDALKELQIVNCPKLTTVEGLNCIFFPELLTIEQCPQLPLSKDDWPPFIPPHSCSYSRSLSRKQTATKQLIMGTLESGEMGDEMSGDAASDVG